MEIEMRPCVYHFLKCYHRPKRCFQHRVNLWTSLTVQPSGSRVRSFINLAATRSLHLAASVYFTAAALDYEMRRGVKLPPRIFNPILLGFREFIFFDNHMFLMVFLNCHSQVDFESVFGWAKTSATSALPLDMLEPSCSIIFISMFLWYLDIRTSGFTLRDLKRLAQKVSW